MIVITLLEWCRENSPSRRPAPTAVSAVRKLIVKERHPNMLYTMENGFLEVTVNTLGGELWEIRTKDTPSVPCLWNGTPEIWPRRAPVCFPWCGALEDGWFQEGDNRFLGGNHGFVRDLEHTLVERSDQRLHFRLDWPGDDSRWPWAFSFETVHVLDGNRLVTTCTAFNRSDRAMPAQMGFHPGFRCPLDPARPLEDYAVRFQKPEAPDGTDLFPLLPELFDQGSLCLQNLRSAWVRLEERHTGRYLQVDLMGAPYLLLWSQPGIPGFLCIEPWTGYPGPGHDLSARPGAVLLAPGAQCSQSLPITICL